MPGGVREVPVLERLQRAAGVAQLDGGERRAGAGAGDRDEIVDRLGRQRSDEAVVGQPRDRVLGLHVQVPERGRRNVVNVSSSGLSSRSGRISSAPSASVPR